MRKELKIAIELCCEFSRKFNIKFPKDEIGYIAIHLLGKSQIKNIDNDFLRQSQDIVDKMLVSVKITWHRSYG